MGLVEEVATFLDTESTRFSLGSSLFINFLPEEPNTAASIIETGGGAPNYVLANDLPAWENARIQVACRSTSSVTARANMNDAWFQLQEVTNESLSGRSWLRISSVQSPFLLDRDAKGRVSYAANFDCTRRTTAV